MRSPISLSLPTLLALLATASHALPRSTSPNTLTKRLTLSCNDNGGRYRPVAEAQACVDYLFAKASDECVVSGENTVFCQAGDTVITGSNVGEGGDSSPCRDVAYAAQRVIDSCTTPEGYVGGYDAATGNEALIVSINHR
ncbi:uncharacterized protein DSM5745_08064 [Aspergillus mulundensis]|uniref:Uncharacterized protein n=1 Tax=Aspergillus mulundensis TaxID=1810919 RepID=A0A3D8R919_9EURO|nr:Uncharacterized protein DSM5745_08064 [Aspergillus mulundensis]RDW70553.1 Uncharacterized protein DSM5745_08064 [Aspergillus mulundensis]